MAYQMTGPSFAFCGTFSGNGSISAARWLRKYEHEMSGYKVDGVIPAVTYLENLSMLLTDDAAEWSESHPDAVRLLNETDPTPQAVESFKSLFCERFPSKAVEVTPIPFDVELSELRQRTDEPLNAYYKRVTNLMQRVGAKDRPAATPSTSTLTLLESAMLDTILRSFIRGLSDPETRKEATRGMASSERSLRSIYQLAEEARRTNIEVKKLFEEELKQDELTFYKQLAQRNLGKHQIETLLTSYHAEKTRVHNPGPSWSFHVDPPEPEDLRKPPTYQSEPSRPPLAQNSSKANEGPRTDNQSRQPFKGRYPSSKPLPNRSESRNPWINGSKEWSFKDGRLCIKCGHLGHIASDCKEEHLPAWEQAYLREIVFGQPPQVSFAAAGYGSYDGASKPYGSYSIMSSQSGQSADIPTPQTSASSQMSGGLSSPSSHSISFGFQGLREALDANAVDANIGEGSGPNKRAYVEDEYEVELERPSKAPNTKQTPLPQPQSAPQPAQFQQPPLQQAPPPPPQAAQAPLPQPSQTYQQYQPMPMPQPPAGPHGPQYPQAPQGPQMPQQQYQFQAQDSRPKKKGQKKVGKKVEMQPIVGMFNDRMGKYDSPVSIREMLQRNKVDMSWMDLVAWSPAVAREIKRLCTRVAKKRNPKPKLPQAPQQFFNPQMNQPFVPQFPQASQVPQAYQPQPVPFQPGMTAQPVPVVPVHQVPPQTSQPSQTNMSQETLRQASQSSQQPLAIDAYSTLTTTDGDRHTRFLSTLVGHDKAFRINATIMKSDGTAVKVDKKFVQADQGSDMNVVSIGLAKHLGLELRALEEVGFRGLSMRCADYRESTLKHWVWLRVAVEGIVRDVRCFVAPEIPHPTETGSIEYLSLILGLPWLFAVDAVIAIRQSKISVGDVKVGEVPRDIVGPELVFCKDHNLLMYPKSVMVEAGQVGGDQSDSESEGSESDDEGEDDLSDVDEPVQPFH